MALSTLDGLVAAAPGQRKEIYKTPTTGVVANWWSAWAAVGMPTAGAFALGNATTGVVPTKATTGAIDFVNPSSGSSYLGRLDMALGQTGAARLYDRLWHFGDWIPTTVALAITPPALTRPDALGENVGLWLEIATATSAVATFTATYTNQAGTTGQTATLVTAGTTIGLMQQFNLASGDTGVRAVTNIVCSAVLTGTVNLILARPVGTAAVLRQATPTGFDGISLGLPRIYNDACLALMVFLSSGSVTVFSGSFDIVQG